MQTDNYQLDRLRNQLTARKVSWEEKRMFGGTCFMVDDKMCFGTHKADGLMVRVDPEESEALSQRAGVMPMVHNGRVMPGFLFLSAEACDSDQELDFWVNKCLAFNPKAKASKKKKKSS